MRLYVRCSGPINILCEKVLHTLSYEPLTHTGTCASFEAAMKHCGGEVVSVTGTAERRSVQKGEMLQDTNRTLACYGDAVVSPILTLAAPSHSSAAKYSPR
jgi:carbamoyl-phosphate synthase/aspartate carbamoyltransferase